MSRRILIVLLDVTKESGDFLEIQGQHGPVPSQYQRFESCISRVIVNVAQIWWQRIYVRQGEDEQNGLRFLFTTDTHLRGGRTKSFSRLFFFSGFIFEAGYQIFYFINEMLK